VTWIAFTEICEIHGLCGKNGLCFRSQSRAIFSCAPNYEVSDPSDWSKGCKPKFNISSHEPSAVTFVQLPKSDYWGYDLNFSSNVSLYHCKNICRRDCTCQVIQYNNDCTFVDAILTHLYTKNRAKIKWAYFYGFIAAIGLIEILFVTLG
jgi:hypothetical protein